MAKKVGLTRVYGFVQIRTVQTELNRGERTGRDSNYSAFMLQIQCVMGVAVSG